MFRTQRLSQAMLLPFALALACTDAGEPAAIRPNVVLVVLDTTRSDHLSAFGYGKPTSPRLAALSADALLFDRAYATSCWTVPSHASLFTGLLPVTHGATQEHVRLDEELETLAELLAARGYQTAAFSNNSWVSALSGLTRGFDEVFPLWREEPGDPAAPHATDVAVRSWLSGRDPEKPFLLFVNLIEPHWPYAAPQSHQDRFIGAHVPPGFRRRSSFSAIQWYLGRVREENMLLPTRERMYDAELSYVDSILGDLLDGLEAQGLLDESLLVVTSDHGEHLGENRHQGHSFALYEPVLRVPLVVRPPGGSEPLRRSDPVQLPDVFATIVRAAGAEAQDPRVVGRDLLAGPLPANRPIVAEYYRPDVFLRRFPPRAQASLERYRRRLRSIQVGSEKLIWSSDGRHELYDLAQDPREKKNLAMRRPERARRLEARLGKLVAELGRPVASRELGDLDPETEASLRALGYIP